MADKPHDNGAKGNGNGAKWFFGCRVDLVDGLDPIAVFEAMTAALDRARSGKGPTCLLCIREGRRCVPVEQGGVGETEPGLGKLQAPLRPGELLDRSFRLVTGLGDEVHGQQQLTPIDEEVGPGNVMGNVVLVRLIERRKGGRDVSGARREHAAVPPHIGDRQVLAELQEETLRMLEVMLGSLQIPQGPLQ